VNCGSSPYDVKCIQECCHLGVGLIDDVQGHGPTHEGLLCRVPVVVSAMHTS
jgi:hypothetical protein